MQFLYDIKAYLKQQLSSPAHTTMLDQTLEGQDPSSNTAQNIVCMFRKANKLGQEAILYWYYFIEKYDERINNLVASGVKKKLQHLWYIKKSNSFYLI
ncbi:uncharacterized protein OCT59_023729 [Rhizophagus irregularis]|uniref:uncharacterized protein n=1 Tax=Rhizophagus irregularis TaxID=588596 RepID=UPI003329749F|nr:hypothetical protein OCT59_023729 [Rhizophagus irregularis]